LVSAATREKGSTIFAYWVKEPKAYGVVGFDDKGKVTSLEEKPERPKSRYAVPGLYFYDERAVDFAQSLKPSARGELEITDLNNLYLAEDDLYVEMLGRGTAWFDGGTHKELLQASNYIGAIEERQGLRIGSPEEVAYRMGYIDGKQLQKLGEELSKSGYGKYLLDLLDEKQGMQWVSS